MLSLLAIAYTTPWDNYLVKMKVWWYSEDRVLGTIGYVPIEEYSFFVLQTILSSLFCLSLQKRFSLNRIPYPTPLDIRRKGKITILYTLVFLLGILCLFSDSSTYMGLILIWSMPIVLVQWLIGGHYLLRNAKLVFLSIAAPTLYLWGADSLAIALKIWEISPKYTTGIHLGNLPVEEAVFFLVTNFMVIQGFILFRAMKDDLKRFSLLRGILYGNS